MDKVYNPKGSEVVVGMRKELGVKQGIIGKI